MPAAVPGQDKTIVVPNAMTSRADPMLKPRPLVLYHAGCKDGFCAAWVASRALGEDVDFIPVAYGDPLPEAEVVGRDVYIIDFSYEREILEYVNKMARSLLVLDHHKTAEAVLKDLPYCQFDMNRSGAGMAWDHFFPGQKRVWLVDYVEDRDLWRFALPDSKLINAYIQSLRYNFHDWYRAMILGVAYAKESGQIVSNHVDQYIEQVVGANLMRRTFFNEPNIPIINAPHTDISELLDRIISVTGEPFAVGWRVRRNGSISFSLRSRGDFDVSEWAKKYGGGGHKNASGFELSEDNALIFLEWIVLGLKSDVSRSFHQKQTRV